MNLRIQTVILLGLIALILPWLISDFRVFQVNLMLVYAIAVLGLNLLTGYGGQISLGHGAFYAIGAYTAAILMDPYGAFNHASIIVFNLQACSSLRRGVQGNLRLCISTGDLGAVISRVL